jgi:hypothetical protein
MDVYSAEGVGGVPLLVEKRRARAPEHGMLGGRRDGLLDHLLESWWMVELAA